MEQYLGRYAQDDLGLSLRDLLALGRQNAGRPDEPFNMAYLALRGSAATNGVSRLHGWVSRHIFAPLFPRWPEDDVPVGHVTNGVHMPTWDSAAADVLWTEACGKDRWLGSSSTLEADVRRIPDDKLWALRTASRKSLVEFARARVARQMAAVGAGPEASRRAQARLDPDVLTLGFARRFATYKRPNLLLHDPARLIRILKNPERPVQLILAGKAHPADQAGQALIQEWMHFIRDTDANPPVVFLADYDMLLAERLVQGVDVWINTPRRPWEACGTSGMKVLVNGGINLSELDGWWAEAYAPEVGWALGDGEEHGDDPAWDAAEAEALYERLEQAVVAGILHAKRQGHPRRMGGADQGEHGAADPQVRRQPHGVRIHRAALPSLGRRVPVARRRQGLGGNGAGGGSGDAGGKMGLGPIRGPHGRDPGGKARDHDKGLPGGTLPGLGQGRALRRCAQRRRPGAPGDDAPGGSGGRKRHPALQRRGVRSPSRRGLHGADGAALQGPRHAPRGRRDPLAEMKARRAAALIVPRGEAGYVDLDPRSTPARPTAAATPPPIRNQSVLSVGAPVNIRETPEPTELEAETP